MNDVQPYMVEQLCCILENILRQRTCPLNGTQSADPSGNETKIFCMHVVVWRQARIRAPAASSLVTKNTNSYRSLSMTMHSLKSKTLRGRQKATTDLCESHTCQRIDPTSLRASQPRSGAYLWSRLTFPNSRPEVAPNQPV